ncbi:MAG TPA: DUF6691 family protein [Noviherbaspirillum sp.]|nr:DUF6691 family protein [Noviherbaspirillum sp.]
MQILFAFAAGLVFGIGLLLSGMTDPSKVIGFLDLAGRWDASLAFVMAGAVAVGTVAFRIAAQRPSSFLGEVVQLPSTKHIDRRLILGGLIFGAGWGLAGLCPGSALVNLATGSEQAAIFVLAMLAGMAIFELNG